MTSAEPRRWVVDASVAFGWFAAVAGSEKSVSLLEAVPPAVLIAPDLVLVELLNAGWKARRMGAITEAQFEAIAELAPSLFSELVPAATLLSAAQRWCRSLDHPAAEAPECAGSRWPGDGAGAGGDGLSGEAEPRRSCGELRRASGSRGEKALLPRRSLRDSEASVVSRCQRVDCERLEGCSTLVARQPG